jgi:RNA polymerase sigma factor (sigma-70 family)
MRRLSEREAFHSLKTRYPGLTSSQFADCVVQIERALSSRQSWLRSVSNPRHESISSTPRDPHGRERGADLPDLSQDPEGTAARREYLEALGRALDQLPAQHRLVVRLKFEQELSLAQIARLTGLDGPRAAQSLLHKTIGALHREITRDMEVPVSVKDG